MNKNLAQLTIIVTSFGKAGDMTALMTCNKLIKKIPRKQMLIKLME